MSPDFSSIKENLFQTVGRSSKCAVEDAIVIAGSPRSGTTWLLETLRMLPGYKAINEPLGEKEARHHNGFSWRTYLEPNATAPPQRTYIESILTGTLGNPSTWHFEARSRLGQLFEHATREKLIVKFCRLNRMLHWFNNQFDVRGTIFLVRHPCAVISSMLRWGEWDEDCLHGHTRRAQALHDESLPGALEEPFAPILNRIDTQVEVLATMWCLDHYVPLVHHAERTGTHPWLLAPYERLVMHGVEELHRIAAALKEEVQEEMITTLTSPSSTVKDSYTRDRAQQLSKWKRHLSTEQINQILRILEDVGLSSIWTDEVEPNYKRLNQMQKPAWQW